MNLPEVFIIFFTFNTLPAVLVFSNNKKGITYANRMFFIFLMLFSFGFLCALLFVSKYYEVLRSELLCAMYVPFSLFGPIFYFYIRNLATGQRITLNDGLHFVPFFLVIALFLSYRVFALIEPPTLFEFNETDGFNIYTSFFGPSLTVLLLCYACLIDFRYINYGKDPTQIMEWIRKVNIGFLLFGSSFVFYFWLCNIIGMVSVFHYLLIISMVIIIGVLSYFWFIHPGPSIDDQKDKTVPMEKYRTSGLSVQYSSELKKKLVAIMENEQPFLDPELNLDMLSEMLDITRHQTSQIINEQFGMNFYEFVNFYRVQMAKTKLKNKTNLSIKSVAFDCGFNNRISFYKSFKKTEGLPPAEYRNQFLN